MIKLGCKSALGITYCIALVCNSKARMMEEYVLMMTTKSILLRDN